jgi:hypothetical protein
MGTAPEFIEARARVAAGTTVAHTEPTYELGTDEVRDREAIEASFV